MKVSKIFFNIGGQTNICFNFKCKTSISSSTIVVLDDIFIMWYSMIGFEGSGSASRFRFGITAVEKN